LIHTFYRELENFPPGNDSPGNDSLGNDSTNENDVNKKALARINGAMYEIENKAKSDITTYHELDNLATDLEDVLSVYTKNHEKLQDMKDPPMPAKKHSNSMKRGPIKLEAMEKDAKKKAKTLKKNAPELLWPMITKESIPIAKVTDVYNPSGDGNCGFRCL
ncbi:hypothetical protein, partial, partial [Absidia glauca]